MWACGAYGHGLHAWAVALRAALLCQVVSATTKKRLLIKSLHGLKQSKDGIQVGVHFTWRVCAQPTLTASNALVTAADRAPEGAPSRLPAVAADDAVCLQKVCHLNEKLLKNCQKPPTCCVLMGQPYASLWNGLH